MWHALTRATLGVARDCEEGEGEQEQEIGSHRFAIASKVEC